MLVLSRKINQSIMVGDDVEIMIVDIKQDQVKIGIIAPKQVKVYRKEIFEEIKAANIEAQNIKPSNLEELLKRAPKKQENENFEKNNKKDILKEENDRENKDKI